MPQILTTTEQQIEQWEMEIFWACAKEDREAVRKILREAVNYGGRGLDARAAGDRGI
jgi:hypothetical protein